MDHTEIVDVVPVTNKQNCVQQKQPFKDFKAIKAHILSCWYFLVLQHIYTCHVQDKGKQRQGELCKGCNLFTYSLLHMAFILFGQQILKKNPEFILNMLPSRCLFFNTELFM